MFMLASHLGNMPVMSMQTGEAIAVLVRPLIDLSSLNVIALRCKGARTPTSSVILLRDVRQFASDCIIVDSFDDIVDAREIVRLRSIISTDFNPVDKPVFTDSSHHLGKVEDYTINLETYDLQKLYIHQSLIKSVIYNNLVIDRSQISNVTSKRIVVRDAVTTTSLLAKARELTRRRVAPTN